MKLILLPKRGGQSLTLDTARGRDILTLAALAILPFVLGCSSFWLYQSANQQVDDRQMLSQWQTELARQSVSVDQAQLQISDELSAMTIKVAELQARVMRLDALGEQVAQVARLDNGEFDFSRKPALGGPERKRKSISVAGITAENQTSRVSDTSLQQMLDQLAEHIDNREQQLALLDKQLNARESRLQAFVAGRPVSKGWMSSAFGKRIDPFNGNHTWHEGVDFAGKSGADVIAVAGGVITQASRKSGYGRMLEINHGNGYVTRYAHNDSNLVEVGDVVDKGQVIAMMGSTGRSTGPHVHFEVLHNGKAINPERFIHRASL